MTARVLVLCVLLTSRISFSRHPGGDGPDIAVSQNWIDEAVSRLAS